jgi:2-polyprenyl-3-methyl-5-hydroxy-6-metoxy-1,4-benzoquinol methylase
MRDRLFGAPGVWSISRCLNASCGFLWLNPQPIPEDTGKLYTGTYYTHKPPEYSKLKRLTRRLKQGGFGRLVWSSMYHQGDKKGRLLEVGSGAGYYLNEMRGLGWTVEGVDFDEGAVKCAKEAYGLNVQRGTLKECRFPDNTFDAITANHVLEHIHDPFSLLKECLRILKPGGRLVVTCPNAKSLGHKLFKDACYHLDPPRHLYAFTNASLKALAQKAGLKVLSARSTVNAARHICTTSREIRRIGKSPQEYMPSKFERALGVLFMAIEFLTLIVNKDAGEELVLVARKNR